MASVTFDPVASRGAKSNRRAPGSKPGPAPRPVVVQVAAIVVGLGFGVSVGLALTAETRSQLRATGGVLMFLGSLTGLSGTYLALVMVLLVSRIPWVERVLGQDGLLRWHRALAPWPITLISAHAIFLTVAYAEVAKSGVFHELGALVNSYPNMLTATVGLGLMVAIGIASIRQLRTRIRRESWWAFHLLMYVALALAFAHEIALGPSFVGHPLTRLVWSIAWGLTAGLVVAYRIGLPVVRSLRHRLRIVEIRPEAPGVVSVILEGRHLDRLALSGGQFFEWRFLARDMWWQAHPFTLSARPRPPYLRLTVKAVGDFSTAVADLRPGTRVAIEGPYGAFTTHARLRNKVAMIAGGIGVTALRSLLEDLPRNTDPAVVLRARTEDELVLKSEVAELVRHRKGRVYELLGHRDEVDLARIGELVPDIAARDVFISGSEGFVEAARAAVQQLGVANEAIHYEVYAL